MSLLLFFGLFTYGLPSSRGGVYLRCLGVYLRCYRPHGGCGFEYTSGGSCGRACIIPPKSMGYLPPVEHRSLCLTAWGCIPPVVSPTLGGSRFEYTSGGSCGRACIVPPKNWDIYLRCYRHLPAVLKCAYPAGDVYLRCVFSPLTFNPYLCSIKY